MDIYELQLEHSPKDKRPFTIYASSEIGLLELWFTQEQMDEIFVGFHAPVMRARAERSTPGLVHP